MYKKKCVACMSHVLTKVNVCLAYVKSKKEKVKKRQSVTAIQGNAQIV